MKLKAFLGAGALALALTAGQQTLAGEQLASTQADIVETAIAAEGFDTLVAAVQAAGLVETLKGDGPFTVFAPTDEAFATLPEGTVEMLLKPENKDLLVQVLTYHVVSGAIESRDLAGNQTYARTVEGQSVWINALSDNGIFVNPTKTTNASTMSQVVAADIKTSNGVIHVIDKVLLPPSM